MKVVYTAAARDDVRDIGEWLAVHYPDITLRVGADYGDSLHIPRIIVMDSGNTTARRADQPAARSNH